MARKPKYEIKNQSVPEPDEGVRYRTLAEVARKLEVDASTVSLVLSGSNRVNEFTRQRVLAFCERVNYRPNQLARGLSRGRSSLWGVLFPDIMSSFFPAILEGIETVANEEECSSFLALSKYDPEQMASQIRAMEARYVDGILLVPTGQPGEKKILAPLLKETAFVPLVQPLAGDPIRTCVHVDDEYGLWLGTSHLISLGHRRIGLLGGMGELEACVRRRNGWARALTEHGLRPDGRLVDGTNFGRECGYESAQKLLQSSTPPTALMGVSDYVALGAMEAILEMGLRPGEDIAVVGFDNICCAQHSPVPLTTVSQPKEELGEAAARALVERIAGRRPRLPTLLPQLVVRRSCGAYKVSPMEAARKN